MKKFYTFRRTLSAMFLLMMSALTWAYDFEVDGICYNLNEDGKSVEVTSRLGGYSGDIVIPSTVTYEDNTYSVISIGDFIFSYCYSLTSVDIQNGVTSIGFGAFQYCYSLEYVSIPESVTSIGIMAFADCSSLKSISIPASVNIIGEDAFVGCSSLTSITVASENTIYDSRERCNAIVETSSNTLIAGCQNTVIPKSVTSIGSHAFSYCSSLTSISIHEGITNIGSDAFVGCSSLTSITVASENPVYDSREECNAIIETSSNTLIAGCQNTVIPNSVISIGEYGFYGCSSLTSIEIPNSVTSIGYSTFTGCSSLTSIEIPNSVTSIGNGAFSSCTSLTYIKIPNGVTSIGSATFYNCTSLTYIEIPNSVTSIEQIAFGYCSSLTTMVCYAPYPPYCSYDIFGGTPIGEATLYVPASAIEDYKSSWYYNDFGTILPLEDIPASISNVEADATNAPYYTLDGIQVGNPTQKGIYIKNGKKVMIK